MRSRNQPTATAAVSSRDDDFEAWMVARHDWLQRTAYLLAGDPHTADDLVQATLAKLYLAWDRVRDRDHLDGYVRTMLLNELRSTWRRPWRRRELSIAELPERPQEDRAYDGVHDALWTLVRALPERQRAVLVLRYYEQFTEAETADVLGISVGTVKSQCSHALSKLRAGLGEEER